MATRTQVGYALGRGCVHERICEALYEEQRRRVLALCQWMMPAAEARELAVSVLKEAVGAWSRSDLEVWPEPNRERWLECVAAHFRGLFHGDGLPAPTARESSSEFGPRLVADETAQTGGDGGVRAAVGALPSPLRLLYLMHELEGCSALTLAHWLDLEPATCAALIHQARQQLRGALRTA